MSVQALIGPHGNTSAVGFVKALKVKPVMFRRDVCNQAIASHSFPLEQTIQFVNTRLVSGHTEARQHLGLLEQARNLDMHIHASLQILHIIV